MNLKDLCIGYVPVSKNLQSPGDRRRFAYYAASRDLNFEIADPEKKYDVVVLTQNADLSIWRNYKLGGAKIVYDLIDSYLAVPRKEIKGRLRGLAKFFAGKSKYPILNQWTAIESMCRRADAVVCSTEEQARDIKPFCDNVHIVLDVHNSVQKKLKEDYSSGQVFNIVWEGLGNNAFQFRSLANVFSELDKKHEIALHFVTDLSYRKFLGKYYNVHTKDIVKKLCRRTYVYEWNELMCSDIICAADLAVIPIDVKNPLVMGKPENKLLLFWRLGIPTITTATPAYVRAMKKANLDMTCGDQSDWFDTIDKYILDQGKRQAAAAAGREVAEQHYSSDQLLQKWDNVFQSIRNS